MSATITFPAESVFVEAAGHQLAYVTIEADMRAVVEDIDVCDRLHDLEPSDIVETMGAPRLLAAMGEKHFAQWVERNGDFYEALNAIGIERIQEWVADYAGGE